MNDIGLGKIITFYSYKGGAGRTMALANVAWILASNGKRVLAADWDLESPGLHRFFSPFLDDSIVSATPGVIEIINNYMSAATAPQQRPPDWHREYARVLPHAVSLAWEHFPDGGTLDFLSAGRQNRDYSVAVCSIDWDNFYDRLDGSEFFRAMRVDMKQNYDYTLIDSRTGLSGLSDICTIELPDTLVICFTLNDQSMDGASAVARQINGQYADRNIRILPVPMRIDDGNGEKLSIGRRLARTKFNGFPEAVTPEAAMEYWGAVEVPYKSDYAYEEMLATFGDDPASPASLLAAFGRITSAVTVGLITTMPPLAEDLRLRYRDAFTRHRA
jgi:cellulose biosynthesis protein BcsQ